MTDRLKSVCEKTGVPVAQLVRIATENYLDEIESSKSVTIELRETSPSYGSKTNLSAHATHLAKVAKKKASLTRKSSKKSVVQKHPAPSEAWHKLHP
jgi:hypothetical protein